MRREDMNGYLSLVKEEKTWMDICH